MNADDSDEPMFNESGIPEALRPLIDNPPLLEGEKPEHYLSLLRAVVDDQKPKGIMDWFNCVDTANKYWEEQRLRCASAALVQCNLFSAVNYFLNEMRPLIPHPLESGTFTLPDVSDRLALQYFSKDPSVKKQALASLAQRGITLTELQAKAMELSSEPLQMLERMIAARGHERRRLREETARSRDPRA